MYVCHSVNKKEINARAVLYHMENWGLVIPETYGGEAYLLESDYHQMCTYIEKQRGVVIILTPYLMEDLAALVELDIIKSLFANGKIKVFTFSYGVDVLQLPGRMEWLSQTEVIQIEGMESVYEGICQVIGSQLEECIEKLGDVSLCKKTVKAFVQKDAYLLRIFEDYMNTEQFAVRTKIILLYTMYCYIAIKYQNLIQESFYGKCIRHLFESVDYYTQCGQLQLKIAERSFLLLICQIVELVSE